MNFFNAPKPLVAIEKFLRLHNLLLLFLAGGGGFIIADKESSFFTINYFDLNFFDETISLNFTHLMLFIMMMCAASKTSLQDLKKVFDSPRPFGFCVATLFFLSPLIAILISVPLRLILPGNIGLQISIGLIAISVAPVTMTTLYWLNLLRGNISFATLMVTLTSTLAPFTTTFAFSLTVGLVEDQAGLPWQKSVGTLIMTIWLPFLFMLVTKKFFANLILKLKLEFSILNSLSLLSVIFAVMIQSAPIMKNNLSPSLFLLIFAIVMVSVFLNFAVTYWLSNFFNLARIDKVTAIYLTSMRSNGTAASFITSTYLQLYPLALIVPAISVFQHVIGKLVYTWLVRKATPDNRRAPRHAIPDLKVKTQQLSSQNLIQDEESKYLFSDFKCESNFLVENISLSGVTIKSQKLFVKNSMHALQLTHELLPFPVILLAKVIWCSRLEVKNEIKVGLSFVDMSIHTQEILESFLLSSKNKNLGPELNAA